MGAAVLVSHINKTTGHCGGSLISRWLVATAFHCMQMKDTCRYKTEKKHCKNISKLQCEKKVKQNCKKPDELVDRKPDQLCDPSKQYKELVKRYVIVGTHYTHQFQHRHKIFIKEVHAPSKQGNQHDFAILVLEKPVPNYLEQWKKGLCCLHFCVYEHVIVN